MKNIYKLLGISIIALSAIFSLSAGEARAQIIPTIPCPLLTPIVSFVGSQTLALTYDSDQKESQLTSSFNISVNGGTTGAYILNFGSVTYINQTDNGKNSSSNANLIPTTFASTTKDIYGQTMYIVSPGQTVQFTLTNSVKPLQMFAGSYYAKITSLFTNVPDQNCGGSLVVPLNQTNSKTIIGEISPFISSITPNPISSGQKMSLNGQRLIGAMGMGNLYIDNLASTATVDGSKDGTTLFFTLPTLTDGWHTLHVRDNVNGTGESNNINFEVRSSTNCYNFTTNLRIGSTGTDVAALQSFLISKGFAIPGVDKGTPKTARFGVMTYRALKLYQTSVGLPATGFFGPLTRAQVNGDCGPVIPTTPSITVLSPNGGEIVALGNTIPVTWTTNYDSTSVKVHLYSPTLGDVYVSGPLISTGKGGINNYYNIPVNAADAGGQYKVNVCDDNQSPVGLPGKSLCDLSDNYFTITSNTTQPSATITSEARTTSLTPTISGKASGVSQVGVVLSDAGGKAYGSGLIPVTNGTWSVTVSPALVVGQYTVIIYDANNNKLTSGYLDVALSTQPSITVTSPNGGEIWNYGKPQTIKWNSNGITLNTQDQDFRINFILPDGQGCWIDRADVSAGQYVYTPQVDKIECPIIPQTLKPGPYYIDLALLSKVDNKIVARDKSDAPFTIASSTITTPVPVASRQTSSVWNSIKALFGF